MRPDLVVGATLPDFRLPDQTGALQRLSELQGSDPMVLLLGRGEHCPRERQHQREMIPFHQWCAVAFTSLVTVLPNDLHDVGRLRSSTGAYWPFLADADLEVQTTLDIREYTDTHHAATVPHALVLAPGLVIDKVYVGYWFWGRPSPQDLWADLRDLNRRIRPDYDPTVPAIRAAWEAEQRAAASSAVPALGNGTGATTPSSRTAAKPKPKSRAAQETGRARGSVRA